LVLAGETCVSFASLNTFCIDCATLEFSGPTTPMTALSATSAVALVWPMFGVAWSSFWTISNVMPGTSLVLLAFLIARSAECSMPRPSGASEPDSGASRAILTTLLAAPVEPLAAGGVLDLREPQADSASAPTTTGTLIFNSEL